MRGFCGGSVGGKLDWSSISSEIFGSLFYEVLTGIERRSFGRSLIGYPRGAKFFGETLRQCIKFIEIT